MVEKHFKLKFTSYHEPFLGGGAVFFHLAPRSACLSDVNAELINTYVQVRDGVEAVITGLSELRANERTFTRLRKHIPPDGIARAVRFIYLNKTAFNGIYRVNKQGAFNVPFAGYQRRRILEEEHLRKASAMLEGCEILARDFSEAIAETKDGSLLYCDPPYTVRHNNNGFIRYNESLFSWEQQKILAAILREAVRRGVFVVVSNADHDCLRRLYRGFATKTVGRVSCMASDPARRGYTSECLFIGDPARF